MREIIVSHGGTMRFWGDWFGRPMDNHHRVVSAVYDEDSDILVMTFDGQEECTIYSPVGITSTEHSFYVEDAKTVSWSWYYYGREHTEKNKFQIHYQKQEANTVIRQKDEFDCTQSTININPNGFHAVEIC